MRKRIILIIAILFLISFIIILIYGRTSEIEYNIGKYENISIDYNYNIIKCNDKINIEY